MLTSAQADNIERLNMGNFGPIDQAENFSSGSFNWAEISAEFEVACFIHLGSLYGGMQFFSSPYMVSVCRRPF